MLAMSVQAERAHLRVAAPLVHSMRPRWYCCGAILSSTKGTAIVL